MIQVVFDLFDLVLVNVLAGMERLQAVDLSVQPVFQGTIVVFDGLNVLIH